jgi:hypothetical protein
MHKTQSGRSMIEMLGVLAIVGVLSVGALAGYSMAMAKYKVNKATDEIIMYIREVQDLASDAGNYKSMMDAGNINSLLKQADIMPDDGLNILEGRMDIVVGSANLIHFRYGVSSKSMCRNILLMGWYNELGSSQLYGISVENMTDMTFYAESGGTFPVPITVADASVGCENMDDTVMSTIDIVIRH